MSLIIIAIIFIVLWLLIEVFSVVLKMTGLDLRKSRFQIISIITHTGFTTRESELITQHTLRRKIASTLMVISYVSQATLISLFVNILTKNQSQLIYVGVLLLVIVAFLIIVTRSKHISSRFDRLVEKILSKNIVNQKKTSIDQVLKVSRGYGVFDIVLEEDNLICGKSLGDSQLSRLELHVLKVDRGSKVYDFPDAKFVLDQGDRLILYGNTDSVTQIVVGDRTKK